MCATTLKVERVGGEAYLQVCQHDIRQLLLLRFSQGSFPHQAICTSMTGRKGYLLGGGREGVVKIKICTMYIMHSEAQVFPTEI